MISQDRRDEGNGSALPPFETTDALPDSVKGEGISTPQGGPATPQHSANGGRPFTPDEVRELAGKRHDLEQQIEQQVQAVNACRIRPSDSRGGRDGAETGSDLARS